jgi:Protein of unknown function (DUF3293)
MVDRLQNSIVLHRNFQSGLVQAYQDAWYTVDTGRGEFTMRPGVYSPGLAALLQRHGCASAAFLTAFNPGSAPATILRNRMAQHRLVANLRASSAFIYCGVGSDPTHQWPDEPSVLALGLLQTAAIHIARHFGQLALLWSDRRARPRLIWPGERGSFPEPGQALRR